MRTAVRGPGARVVSVAMQKGGVGKSTTIINTARAACLRGLRVLVVDLDPQGNTTDALAVDEFGGDEVSVADAMLPVGAVPVGEVLVRTVWDGVDLAPVTSGLALSEVERRIAAATNGREYRLAEALAPVLGDYDLVLIDNAPSLGLLLVNALAVSDNEVVLVVMEADRWSTNGLAMLREAIEGVRRYTNRSLGWAGVLISKWRGTRDEKNKLTLIQEHFPEAPVWASEEDTADVVPLWNSIKTTINEGKGMDEAKDTRLRVTVAGVYDRLLDRLLTGESEKVGA